MKKAIIRAFNNKCECQACVAEREGNVFMAVAVLACLMFGLVTLIYCIAG